MKHLKFLAIPAVILVTIGTALPASAEPGGCLKYGAAGALGGHFLHHHAVLGAAGGCALGAWRRHEYRKEQRAQAATPRTAYAGH